MQSSTPDTQLDLLESLYQELAASLLDGKPADVLAGGAQLQRLAVELMQLSNGPQRAQFNTPRRLQRIRILASGVGSLRENMLRQMAYVDRALEIVVPATREKATYGGGGAGGAYGQPVRQSGAFSVLAA